MYYKRFELTCEIARNNEVIELGEVFSSFLIVKNDVPCSYRINLETNDVIHADELAGFEHEGSIRRLFITHDAATIADKIVVIAYK